MTASTASLARPRRTGFFALLAIVSLVGCSHDWASLEGGPGDPMNDAAAAAPDAFARVSPNVGIADCEFFTSSCPTYAQPCAFDLIGDATSTIVEVQRACGGSLGSSNEGQWCQDAGNCSFGLSCLRPARGVDGICIDTCGGEAYAAEDCNDPEHHRCDTSAVVATVDGIPIYRCVAL